MEKAEADLGEIGWRELLIARALGPSHVVEDEALFLSLPAEKRDLVIERLRALDGYLRLPDPTIAKADETAAKIGVSRRTFYHLLGKLKLHGPVKGLALGFRLNRRPSVARDGLNGVAEQALLGIFNDDPEIGAGAALRAVTFACSQEGVAPPKETEVRFRLHELRRAFRRPSTSDLTIGSSILVDQCYIDLTTTSVSGELRQVIVTLAVDRPTKLILGHGLSFEDQDATGLESAVFQAAHHRLPSLAGLGLRFETRPKKLEFVVPSGFEGIGKEWAFGAIDAYPDLEIAVNDAGPLRHGFALVRLLGDRLGIYKFKPRTRPGDVKLEGMINHTPEDCMKVVGYCVDTWNRSIAEGMVKGNKGRVPARPNEVALANSLTTIFELFTRLIEDRFPNALLYCKLPRV